MPLATAALAAELNTDPKALGYKVAGEFRSDYDLAGLLNAVGTDTIFKSYTDIADVIAAINMTEYGALSTANKTFLNEVILKGQRLKTGDAGLRSTIGSIFAAGTATRTALVATASRAASRAEVLWGEGVQVTDVDVATALGRAGA